MTNSEEALASVSTAGPERGAADGKSRTEGSLASAARSSLSSLQWATRKAPATSEAIIDLVAATERSAPACKGQKRVGLARERRVRVVDERNRHRARLPRRTLHGDDVRASARLRNGDRERVGEPQPGMIERGDRRPERSAGERDLKLDEMLEVEGRMIGAAARDRHRERRFARPQSRRQLGGRRRIGGQLAAHDRAAFRDLRGHEGLAHPAAPSIRPCNAARLCRNTRRVMQQGRPPGTPTACRTLDTLSISRVK